MGRPSGDRSGDRSGDGNGVRFDGGSAGDERREGRSNDGRGSGGDGAETGDDETGNGAGEAGTGDDEAGNGDGEAGNEDETGNGGEATGNGTDETGDGTDENGGETDEAGAETDRPSTAEKVVMVVSVAFTLLLFAFAGWQMATTPAASTPSVSVDGTERLENGSVAVTVVLRNPDDVGLVSATVGTDCTSPRTELRFTYMPASSERTGTLVCPAGTTDPSVSMVNWQRR